MGGTFVFCRIIIILITHGFCQTLAEVNIIPLPNEFVGGQKGHILCANSEEGKSRFYWLKDGASYPNVDSADVKQVDETTTSRLLFKSLEASHSGNYTCIVESGSSIFKKSIIVYVKVPPRWLIEPSDAAIQEDSTVVLDCDATGYPKPSITWVKTKGPNEQVPVRDIDHVTVSANNSLIIHYASKFHSGVYTCQAQSGYGDDLKKSVKLTVYVPPKLQTPFTSKTVEIGKSISLSCDARGDQPLLITWWKRNESVNKWPSRYEIKEETKQTTITSVLFIKQVDKSDDIIFSCKVENRYGHDQSNIKLIILEPPYHPVAVTIGKVWSRSARIVWETSPGTYNRAHEFVVEYWSTSDPEGLHKNITVSGSNTWYIINNLQPATNYRLQIWAKNNVGISQPSEQVVFVTGNEEPSAPPRDFHLEEVGATYARLSWRPPPHRHWNGEITGFYVGYRSSLYNEVFSYYTVALEGDVHSFVLRNLRKSSPYHVIVRAFNSVGSGPATDELVFRTKSEDLVPKPDLFIETWSPTSLKLRWIVHEVEDVITGFTISYRKEGHQWREITIPSGIERSFALTDLENNQLYHMFIVANSNRGSSEPSEIATIRTTAPEIHELSKENVSTPKESKEDKEKTRLLYIIIPVCIAVIIIVIVIAVAYLYVYSKNSRVAVPAPYLPCTDEVFVYTPSTLPRHYQGMLRTPLNEPSFKYSPDSTMRLKDFDRIEEPIYETVADEIRNTMKWKEKELESKLQRV